MGEALGSGRKEECPFSKDVRKFVAENAYGHGRVRSRVHGHCHWEVGS
jgi:hypothetical protein